MFIQIPWTPIQLHAYSGDNWTHLKACVVTGRNEDGTQRETAIQVSGKSDHLLEVLGDENPADVVTVNGTAYHGRIAKGVDGDTHYLTAIQVAARAEQRKALKAAAKAASEAAAAVVTPSPNGAKPAEPVAV